MKTRKNISLKNLGSCTPMEVLTYVSEHLLKQGQAATERSNCKYRTANGLKCAAGSLIADDEYSPEMEGKYWSTLILQGLVPDFHETLIRELQAIHDDIPPSNWPRALELLKNLTNPTTR